MAAKNKADSDGQCVGKVDSTSTPSIVGLGYPLVDLLSTTINPNSFGLASGETVLATSSLTYSDLFSQLVLSQDTKIIAGGSTLNTIRILQWLFSTSAFENVASFIGCVGNDKYSHLLQSAMLSDFVIPILETIKGGEGNVAQGEGMSDEITCDNDNDKEILSTGTSGVLVSPSTGERTLVTFLGASKHLSQSFIQSQEPWRILTKCRWVFSCGFMCQSSEHYQIASLVAKMSLSKVDKCGFAINIGAPYICRNFTKQLFSLLFFSDIIFANKDEAFALAEAAGWMSVSTTLEEIAIKIAELRDNEMVYKTRRIVALTCGKDPTVFALFDLSTSPRAISFSIPIHPDDIVPNEKIVDLTGAGDAFAGGFMAYVMKSTDPHIYTSDCILNATRTGHWAASRVVRSQGATWVKGEGKCPFL